LWLKTVFEVVQSTGFDAGAVRWRFEILPVGNQKKW